MTSLSSISDLFREKKVEKGMVFIVNGIIPQFPPLGSRGKPCRTTLSEIVDLNLRTVILSLYFLVDVKG
jgi:hypothetical protein